jgi:ABC-type branched-subunit amino acid transport system substrate-binding protein
MMVLPKRSQVLASIGALILGVAPGFAQGKYDVGASDAEIKIGNIAPYSGPASSYGVVGKAEAAYMKKINDEGGINGRKINFISYDDAYSPPKSVEQARKLVESDEVLLVFSALGTGPNAAIMKYMNAKKVPQLFVASGGTKFGDPKNFPWTMGWQPNYQSEARIYAAYIREHFPNGKISALWQNDDAGKDQMKGMREGLGDKAGMIVADASYEVTDPTLDSQIARLRNSGADIFISWTSSKAAAQALKKVAELGWKPTYFIGNTSSSVAAVLQPAGVENAKGVISSEFLKDPFDPAWKEDDSVKAWNAFMDKYMPGVDKTDRNIVYAYSVVQTLVRVLKQCGDDLTRENVMKQASNLKDVRIDMLLPGISINTSPTDFFPIEQLQLIQFDGEAYKRIDEVRTGEVGSKQESEMRP